MKILIVDDQQEIIALLKKVLEEESFVVDEASDGKQGSYLARTNDYDLIILDNNMPIKSGKQVAQEIRADGKQTPILMLSVRTDTSSKVDLLNAGADDYMIKPFSFDELIARIRALLRRPSTLENDVIKIDNLFLDSKKYLVKRGAREIHLTKKEFTLLEYLMMNKGNVLSRAMILEHVWDMNADHFSNTIESHILSLRKKIDSGADKKLIVTISGRGYKIIE